MSSPKIARQIRNRCERCGELLHPEREVWLEYDQRTNTYTDSDVPPEVSQGGFPFGKACARREILRHMVAQKVKLPGLTPRPVRAVVLQTRVCAEELDAIKRLAKKYCNGNISEWLRYAAAHHNPLTPEQTNPKLKKRK